MRIILLIFFINIIEYSHEIYFDSELNNVENNRSDAKNDVDPFLISRVKRGAPGKTYLIEKCGCADNDPSCPQWASDGNCDKELGWMRIYCRKSCGDCAQESIPQSSYSNDSSCMDTNDLCCIWANVRPSECSENSEWMPTNCAFSCDTCDSHSQMTVESQISNIIEKCGCSNEIGTCQTYVNETLNGVLACDYPYILAQNYDRFLCRKSCGDCHDITFSTSNLRTNSNVTANSCVDQYSECCVWANSIPSECDLSKEYMVQNCPASCHVCKQEIQVCIDDALPEIFTPNELLILGGILFLTLTICFLPYLSILYVFIYNAKFYSNLTYNLLTFLGFADLAQFSANFLQSFMMMFNTTFSCGISIFTASLLNLSPFLVCLMTLLVSICRFLLIFKLNRKNESRRIFYALTILVFLAGFSHLVINFIPGYRGVLSTNIINPIEEKSTRTIWDIANYTSYVAVGTASLLYIIGFLALIYERGTFGSKLMSTKEWSMFFQTVVPCWVKPIVMYMWVYHRASTGDKALYYLQTWLVIFEASYYPFVYICVNRTIRNELMNVLKCKKNNKKGATIFVIPIQISHKTVTKTYNNF